MFSVSFLSIQVWEHPSDSTSPSHNMFSSPSSLTAKLWSTRQIRPQLFPHFTSQQHSLSPSISLQLALLGATGMGNRSTSHAYQICQLANGRPGWTALQKWPVFQAVTIHSRPTTEGTHIMRGITSFDTSRGKKQRPTAQPQCLMYRALDRSAKHAASSSRPAIAPVSTATTAALRPVSAAHPSSASLLAADRMPLHWPAALLYAAANITGRTQ
jgi:hypothetical protein